MKPLQLLAILPMAAGMLDSSRPMRVDYGVCLSPLLYGSVLSDPVCSSDNILVTKYTTETLTKKSDPAATWAEMTPCFRNGTQEYCVFHAPILAGGRGVSVVTSRTRAEHMARSLAFRMSKDEVDVRNRWNRKTKIAAIPGKEYGVVATERINRGERIISETSSLMVDYGAFELVPQPELWAMQGRGVDFLPHGHRLRFLNMSTHGADLPYLEKIEKILSTNAFDVELDDDDEDNYYSIFAETGRMNHDCRPSVDYIFDPKTLTQHATAVRDIMPGEELTISYIDPLMSREKRLERLHKQWGFHCSCSLCSSTAAQAAASDARISQIHDLRKEFNDYGTNSRATPQMAELMVSLYEQERLWALQIEGFTHAAIEWNGVGEPWSATKYARLAIELGTATLGEDDADVAEMTRLANDPWGHWTWLLRTKKRMSWGPRKRRVRRVEEDDDDDSDDD